MWSSDVPLYMCINIPVFRQLVLHEMWFTMDMLQGVFTLQACVCE